MRSVCLQWNALKAYLALPCVSREYSSSMSSYGVLLLEEFCMNLVTLPYNSGGTRKTQH